MQMSKFSSTLVALSVLVIAFHQIHAQDMSKRKKLRSDITIKKEVHKINEQLKNQSGSEGPPWVATANTVFAYLEDAAFTFGALPAKVRALPKKPPAYRRIPLKPGMRRPETGYEKVPKSYNFRDTYGQKCRGAGHIMYQGACGNCWLAYVSFSFYAVATTSMINDRVCAYQADGTDQKFFSANHLTTCLPKGCDGGWFADALQNWIVKGMVSGGDYRMGQPLGCRAYPQNTADMKNGTCKTTCDDGSKITEDVKSYGGARYEIRTMNEEDIKSEIYFYGPVIATFDVYYDFAHYYTKGIYTKASDNKLGGHAAKLIGWGEDKNGYPYWIGVNSWGKDWGDSGSFKIRRGTNECNIEANIQAALPAEALYPY